MSKSQLVHDEAALFARNIDWNLFKVFRIIARQGGIGAAGRHLLRQQPSISAALKRLEDHVGAPLCTRTSTGITLTALGQRLLHACETMNTAIEQVPPMASVFAGGTAGVVTLRVISNLHLVPPLNRLFEEFHQLYPKVEIKLDVSPWQLVVQSLMGDDVELGIGFDSTSQDRRTKIPVMDQIQQLYCGSSHPLFGRLVLAPEILREEAFVITQNEPPQYGAYRDRYGLGRKVGGVADNLQERMWLIQIGVGIGFLPKPVVEASAFAGRLWPLLPDAAAPVCTLHFMSAASGVRTPPAQLLWNLARRHLPGAMAGVAAASEAVPA